MSTQKHELDWLDGLKGICAFIIAFVWHFRHFKKPPEAPFSQIFPLMYAKGMYIVELFFVLSGFGMMLGYGKRIVNREIGFGSYFKRRVSKLYPLFLLTTLLVVIFEAIIFRKCGTYFVYENYDLYHLLLNLLLLQNGALETVWSLNSPSWVISICILLYILFYFVCYVSRKPVNVFYTFGVVALLGALILLSKENRPLINVLVGRGLTCFSIGVILNGLYVHRNTYNAQLLGYIALVFVLVFYVLMRTEHTEYVGDYQMIIALGIAPMILFSVFSLGWLQKEMSFKPFVFLGHISIGIYLIHFPVQCIIRIISLYTSGINYASKLFWICYMLSVVGLAALYNYVVKNIYEPWLIGLIAKKRPGPRSTIL